MSISKFSKVKLVSMWTMFFTFTFHHMEFWVIILHGTNGKTQKTDIILYAFMLFVDAFLSYQWTFNGLCSRIILYISIRLESTPTQQEKTWNRLRGLMETAAISLRCHPVNNVWRLSLHVCFLKCQVSRKEVWTKKASLLHSTPFEEALHASLLHSGKEKHFSENPQKNLVSNLSIPLSKH